MDERGDERDLKLDLLATQCRCGRQKCNLVDGLGDLRRSLYERGMVQRPLARFAPKIGGLFDLTSLCGVTRQQLRPIFGNLGELTFEGLGDAGVKRASRLA